MEGKFFLHLPGAKRDGFSSREEARACTKVLCLEDTPEDSTEGEGPGAGARNPWGREEEVPLHVRICSLGFVLVGGGVWDRQPLEALNQGPGPP